MYYLEYRITHDDTDIDNYPITGTLCKETICDEKNNPRTRQEVIDIIVEDVLEYNGTEELNKLFRLTHPSYYEYYNMELTIDNRFVDELVTEKDIRKHPKYKARLLELKTLYKKQKCEKDRQKRVYNLTKETKELKEIVCSFKSIEDIKGKIKSNENELKHLTK